LLKVLSDDTVIELAALEPESRRKTDQHSFEFHGMLKGLGRQFPVVVEKTSWEGGDMCTVSAYTFHGGAIRPIASLDNVGCPQDEVPWRVTGSMDNVRVLVDWDRMNFEEAGQYRANCENADPCVLSERRWNSDLADYN
jgi:hypothetical protein